MRPATGFPLALLLLAGSVLPAVAASKGTQFWNLAATTVTHLQMAPAGTGQYGPDQCRNDPDGTVDADERVKVTGIETGSYDVKVAYKDGKVCTLRGLSVEKGKVFSIEPKDLTDCSK